MEILEGYVHTLTYLILLVSSGAVVMVVLFVLIAATEATIIFLKDRMRKLLGRDPFDSDNS